MKDITGAAVIVIMCVIVLCVVALKKKAEFLLNFMLRGITGVISIVFIDRKSVV